MPRAKKPRPAKSPKPPPRTFEEVLAEAAKKAPPRVREWVEGLLAGDPKPTDPDPKPTGGEP